MNFWIETTKTSDPKITYTMKSSIVLFIFTVGVFLGGILGAGFVLLSPKIYKYVFYGICTF